MSVKHLNETLQELVNEAGGMPITFRTFVRTLKGRGIPVFLILVSIPFCLPIQIPGLSTPFGLALAIMGLKMAFGQGMWWPEWLLKREIPYASLKKITDVVGNSIIKAKKFVRPRLCWLAESRFTRIIHGLFIVLMSLLLAMPFPIPFTNLLSAYPILFMGIGLLEDDGILIILSYCIGFFSLLFWFSVFFFGHAGYQKVVSYM